MDGSLGPDISSISSFILFSFCVLPDTIILLPVSCLLPPFLFYICFVSEAKDGMGGMGGVG